MVSVKTVVSFYCYAAFLLQVSTGKSVEQRTKLESAVQRGDIELATNLIKGGALDNEITLKNRDKIYSKLRTIKLLLSNRIAEINTQDNNLVKTPSNKDAFEVVLIPGSSLITRMVLNVSAVKNWGNKTIRDGWKPIHMITSLPDVSPSIVKIVLENGNDDVNTKTKSQAGPLLLAATNGNIEVVKFLVEKGASINDAVPVELEGDELNEHFHFSKLFSNKKLKPIESPFSYTSLIASVVSNNLDVVKYLLSKGADIHNKEQAWYMLFYTVYNNETEMVDFLLRSGIDVNTKNVRGSTALHMAAEAGRIEMAKHLLKNGAHLNATDVLGWMPIHVASFFSRIAGKEMIQFLVQSGSSIKSVTDGGYSVLNLVKAGHNLEFLGFLQKNMDSLNQTKYHKDLPEAYASKMHLEILDSVIQLGAPLNHQDSILGWSTLHWAAASGDLEAAKLLVKRGADINIRSKTGRNSFETAKYFGRPMVAEFLRTPTD